MPDKAVTLSILGQIEEHFRRCKHTYPDLVFEGYEAAVRDAITLIREQEPVKPYAEGDGSFACDNCGETVGWEEMNCGGISMVKYKFCPECGRAVKWDD